MQQIGNPEKIDFIAPFNIKNLAWNKKDFNKQLYKNILGKYSNMSGGNTGGAYDGVFQSKQKTNVAATFM